MTSTIICFTRRQIIFCLIASDFKIIIINVKIYHRSIPLVRYLVPCQPTLIKKIKINFLFLITIESYTYVCLSSLENVVPHTVIHSTGLFLLVVLINYVCVYSHKNNTHKLVNKKIFCLIR